MHNTSQLIDRQLFSASQINPEDIEKIVSGISFDNNSDVKSNLGDVLLEIFSKLKLPDYILTSDFLKNEKIAKKIFSCKEFSEVDSIEVISFPNFILDGKVTTSKTIMLRENTKFKRKLYIYSIDLTSELFDLSCFSNPTKDMASVSPIVYDQKDFTPIKAVSLFWSPEQLQDESAINGKTIVFNNNGEKIEELNAEKKLRKRMHETLDKVLDNLNEYKSRGYRSVMIRGVFSDIENMDLSQMFQEKQPVKIKL